MAFNGVLELGRGVFRTPLLRERLRWGGGGADCAAAYSVGSASGAALAAGGAGACLGDAERAAVTFTA